MHGASKRPATAAGKLTATIAEQQRYRERQRQEAALRYVRYLLERAGLRATVKLSLHRGKPFILVMSPRRDEAMVSVPPKIGGLVVHCAWER